MKCEYRPVSVAGDAEDQRIERREEPWEVAGRRGWPDDLVAPYFTCVKHG
jgi:hypothetical protein